MNTLSTSDYKLVLFCIKYIPVIMFLIMFIHTGLLLMGINLGIADTIVGCAIIPSLLILSISKLLKFCWLHKSLTIYLYEGKVQTLPFINAQFKTILIIDNNNFIYAILEVLNFIYLCIVLIKN